MPLVVLLLNTLRHFNIMETLIKSLQKIRALTYILKISLRLLMPSLSSGPLMSCFRRLLSNTCFHILLWLKAFWILLPTQSVMLTLPIHSTAVRFWEEPKRQSRRQHWHWKEIKLSCGPLSMRHMPSLGWWKPHSEDNYQIIRRKW